MGSRGHTDFYPQFEVTLGEPTEVSWSGKIDDPDDPARLLIRLESTAMGCAWLLDRWGELRDALEHWGKWQPPDRFKAIRLLSRQPIEIWDEERVLAIYLACVPMEPASVHEFQDVCNELHNGQRKRLIERIRERGACRPPEDAESGLKILRSIIAEEEGRLEERLTIHLDRQGRRVSLWSSTPAPRASGCAGTRRVATGRCCGCWRRCGSVGRTRRGAGGRQSSRPARPIRTAAGTASGMAAY